MTCNIMLIALLFLLSVLHSGVAVEYAQKLCHTEDDCDWDQCCIEAETRLPGFSGICSNPPEKGEHCDPTLDKTYDGKYKNSCPCVEGLSCQLKEISFGVRTKHLHVCQP